MSNTPLIWPELKGLLDHYEMAARLLHESTPEETALPDGLPFKGDLELAEGRGMEYLLKLQASNILKFHEANTTGDGEHGIANVDIGRRLRDIELASHARLYSYRFDQVPFYWRQIYSDAQILTTYHILLSTLRAGGPEEQRLAFLNSLDEVVGRLDRCLVTAGGGGRICNKIWIERTMKMIDEAWRPSALNGPEGEFSALEPYGRPQLTRPCERHSGWSTDQFERYMGEGHSFAMITGSIGPEPIVFTDLIKDDWLAIKERRWFRPDYLFRQTIGGRRLVPIEVGRSYVDSGWGQELLPFKEFVVRYIDSSFATGDAADLMGASIHTGDSVTEPGYLAQHDLFLQIPSLRNDILVPDFCWADIPSRNPVSHADPKPKLEVPELNAWFGPARTITPLHTDGYTNLLCQVVGTKYVRLYPPQADELMRPKSKDENGIDMSNTSNIDLGAIEGWDSCTTDDMDGADEDAEEYIRKLRHSLKNTEYFECILEPGDALVIPVGWWHYVRSLSVSFSVSFWWN